MCVGFVNKSPEVPFSVLLREVAFSRNWQCEINLIQLRIERELPPFQTSMRRFVAPLHGAFQRIFIDGPWQAFSRGSSWLAPFFLEPVKAFSMRKRVMEYLSGDD